MSKREPRYIAGDHLVVCDRSGFTYRRSEMIREPKTGFWVHSSQVDPPHPQAYRTPVKPDRQSVYPVRINQLARSPGTGGDMPDGTISNMPEMSGGSIAEIAPIFLGTNEVDPTSF